MTRLVIAMDGPAGAGKSTVARMVAARLGAAHIDTGATYRLVAHRALVEGVPLDDQDQLASLAARVATACELGPDGRLSLDGQPVGDEIRDARVSDAASRVATLPQVRTPLVQLQRRLTLPAAAPHGAVVEGRDIGTVVLPDAGLKVYLDASPRERARRRAADMGAEVEAVLPDVVSRDERDTTRETSPMRPASDAVVIDTTDLTAEQVTDRVVELARSASSPRNPHPTPGRPDLLYRVVWTALWMTGKTVFRFHASGTERIPATGGLILAANHRSLLDIPIVAITTRRKVWFMGKEELFRSKVGAAAFTALGGFSVRRGRPDRRALNMALDLLRQGEVIGVFPEGTRTPDARFDELEDGLAYLALKSGATIVPIALSGTEAVFPKDRKLPRPVRIRALVGEPFTVAAGPATGVVARSKVQAATATARTRLRAVLEALEPPRGGPATSTAHGEEAR